jgi:hypothetical protein
VAAAHTAPVGAYCSAFTVISERTTSSRHSPWYVHRSIHSDQYVSVARSAAAASSGGGGSSSTGYHASENARRSPAATVKSAVVVRSVPSRATGLWKRSPSLPATSVRPSPVACAHGVIEP